MPASTAFALQFKTLEAGAACGGNDAPYRRYAHLLTSSCKPPSHRLLVVACRSRGRRRSTTRRSSPTRRCPTRRNAPCTTRCGCLMHSDEDFLPALISKHFVRVRVAPRHKKRSDQARFARFAIGGGSCWGIAAPGKACQGHRRNNYMQNYMRLHVPSSSLRTDERNVSKFHIASGTGAPLVRADL